MQKQEFSGNIELGFRRVGAASCVLQKPEALPVHMHEAIIEVTKVQVPVKHRNQGYATTLLHKVCREADQAGKTLFIQVESFTDDPIPRPVLESWYSKNFGFAPIQAEPLLMARMPWSTPKVGLQLSPLAAGMIEGLKETSK